ncbi:terpenoid synthase [Apiospora marii]|uniref:terpenoid synthase n=1 Tax=Apiospora marii TaxID=335849 RepID=UPI00312DAC10
MRKNSMGSHDYVQTLKGQKLRFPDFDRLLDGWPRGISPHYEDVKQIHDKELEQLLGTGTKRLETLIAAECSLNAATWWPNSSFDAIRFASHLVAWLYVWDNETDSPEFNPEVCLNWDAGQRFRAETLDHIRAYLSDDNDSDDSDDSNSNSNSNSSNGHSSTTLRAETISSALGSFNPVGEPAAFRMTRGQRQLFLQELVRYVVATGEEQRSELSGVAPTIHDYLPVRMGTSGVESIAVCIECVLGRPSTLLQLESKADPASSFHRYMVNVDLGDELRADPDVQTIFAETNCIISLMNDAFSLQRELQFPFYNNAVAVLYHEHQDLQAAVDQTYELVKGSVARLNASAARLLEHHPDRRADLEAFITGAQTMCTGNIEWSIRNKRYNLGFTKCDGTAEIVI